MSQQNIFSAVSADMTPMMQQYLSIKAQYQDYLLFYRLGDFYELFADDAIEASSILGIVLTARGKGTAQEVPMCGVPVHAYDQYVKKLLDAGKSIAVCEQLESPQEAKKRGYKAVVRRDVVRVLTPGTIIEDTLLGADIANYIVSLYIVKQTCYIVACDPTIGEVHYYCVSVSAIRNELEKLSPKEILISEHNFSLDQVKAELAPYRAITTIRANVFYSEVRASNAVLAYYKLHSLESFSFTAKEYITAVGVLLEYFQHAFKNNTPLLANPMYLESQYYMQIDAATRRNLEINCSLRGDASKSLFAIIDNTVTNAGRRLLHNYLNNPILDCEVISRRLESVEVLACDPELLAAIRDKMKYIPDFERLCSKVMMRRAHYQDVLKLHQGLLTALTIAEMMHNKARNLPKSFAQCLSQLGNYDQLLAMLTDALDPNCEYFIRYGYSVELDQILALKANSKDVLDSLTQKYREMTSVNNLKIVYNNIMGHFIEVTNLNAPKLKDPTFLLKQNLVNVSRFTTEELASLSNDLVMADEKILEIQRHILLDLCEKIGSFVEEIQLSAQALAMLDVYHSLALLARKNNWVKPELDNSKDLLITKGRNPLVEHSLKDRFIANNLMMKSDEHIMLLTAPNMTGKSTYLRQNALIIILAQMGSFVPAEHARIGIVDKVFSRIGASDDLFAGNSTFMIEMIETATILNNATDRSFIVFDELGRGTATADGIAIAHSVIDDIHENIKARTLFATHYHELTLLDETLAKLRNYTIKVSEYNGNIVFLHEIIEGKASSSYGIHVAELAGVPKRVIARAKQLMNQHTPHTGFAVNNDASTPAAQPSFIDSLDIDNISPKDALEILYKMKNAA